LQLIVGPPVDDPSPARYFYVFQRSSKFGQRPNTVVSAWSLIPQDFVFEMWILNDSDGDVEMDIYDIDPPKSSEKQWPVPSNLGPVSQALAFDVFTRPRN